MALYGVSITKNVLWQGKLEEFDNQYYFEGPAEPPDAVGLSAFINTIADAERPVHAVGVKFIRGRVWSAGGTAIENKTLALIDLTGTGADPAGKIFKEAAVVVEWECDRGNVLGRKVYLRKFIRPCSQVAGMLTTDALGETILSPACKTAFKTYADKVQTVASPAGVNWQLRSPAGRLPKANNNAVVNDYVRSREFRRS